MPRLLPFRILNVFTPDQGPILQGNPLCVFENGDGLTGQEMQALALQFNLSETTFLIPGKADEPVRVRIFTPTTELPFAGHPTVLEIILTLVGIILCD
jgi:trans-2,3-dihydro-3-hydroxyanthranilate isomerase